MLLCALVGVTLPVQAQQGIDEATLRQRMAQAEGKPPEQYRKETISLSTALGTYLQREFHRGPDYRIVNGNGPYQHQNGRVADKIWDQSANGLTVISPPLGLGRPHARTVTISRAQEGWRMASLDTDGFGVVEYVDAQTYRPVRDERLTSIGKIVTTFGDYRTIAGYTMPFKITEDNQIEGVRTESDVATFDSRPIIDSDIAIPPSRNFIDFPAGGAPVVLPAAFDLPRIEVTVGIGEKKLKFLLDTATRGITLDVDVARQLGLTSKYLQVIVPEMHVGPLTMHNVVTDLAHVTSIERIDDQAVGLLGTDFFRGAGITVDFVNKRATAVPADKLTPKMTPDSDIMLLSFSDRLPVVTSRINGALAFHMLLDDSAPADVVIFGSFLRRYPEIAATNISRLETAAIYPGASLPDAKGIKVAEVLIGKYSFEVVDATIVGAMKGYPLDADGLIGYKLFDEFALAFDYAGGKLYIIHHPPK